jgi:hypothetical protein
MGMARTGRRTRSALHPYFNSHMIPIVSPPSPPHPCTCALLPNSVPTSLVPVPLLAIVCTLLQNISTVAVVVEVDSCTAILYDERERLTGGVDG